MTAAPLVTIPIWSAVALKLGKRTAGLIGSGVALVGLTGLFFDRTGSTVIALAE